MNQHKTHRSLSAPPRAPESSACTLCPQLAPRAPALLYTIELGVRHIKSVIGPGLTLRSEHVWTRRRRYVNTNRCAGRRTTLRHLNLEANTIGRRLSDQQRRGPHRRVEPSAPHHRQGSTPHERRGYWKPVGRPTELEESAVHAASSRRRTSSRGISPAATSERTRHCRHHR